MDKQAHSASTPFRDGSFSQCPIANPKALLKAAVSTGSFLVKKPVAVNPPGAEALMLEKSSWAPFGKRDQM
jgi:hypothetical protein